MYLQGEEKCEIAIFISETFGSSFIENSKQNTDVPKLYSVLKCSISVAEILDQKNSLWSRILLVSENTLL